MKPNYLLLAAAVLFLIPVTGLADTLDPATINVGANYLSAATNNVFAALTAVGLKLFFALTVLQLVITGYGQIASGEIDATLAKFGKAIIWTSFCLYLMTNNHGANLVSNTIQYFLNNSIGWASGVPATFDANGIVNTGLATIGGVMQAIILAATPKTGATSFLSYFTGSGVIQLAYGLTLLICIVVVILLTSAYVGLKVFMVKIEAALVVAIMPLSLAFLGLSALRDQGFAPFKSMLALIYRIVILGAVVGGMAATASAIAAYAASDTSPNILEIAVALTFGFVLMAFVAHKSDQIATSLANGSASLGSGDAAGSMMAGAAALAAASAGLGVVASALSGGGATTSTMAEMAKGAGSVTNASSSGSGSTPPPAPPKPSASVPGASSTQGGPPRRADFAAPAAAVAPSGGAAAPAPAPSQGAQNDRPASAPAAFGASPQGTSAPAPAPGMSGDGGGDIASSEAGSESPAGATAGTGLDAGIGGAPQRQTSTEPDMTSAPKRPAGNESELAKMQRHLGNLGHNVQQEKQATHVSVNTGGE